MEIHQIRNATIIVTFKGKKFLIDPWLGPKEYMPGFDSAYNAEVKQPRVDLPISIEDIVNNIDAVILTHFHPDHWDEYAAKALDKNIPFFIQNTDDEKIIKQFGFSNLKILSENGTDFEGVTLYKTQCEHGKREIVKPLCESIGMPYESMGIVFKAPDEKTLYVAGDTIWCSEVKNAIDKFSPDIIVVNACGARVLNGEYLIMNTDDVKTISEYAKNSTIVASHMGTVSHLTVTRDDIKNLKLNNVVVPDDNEILKY